MCFTFLVIKLYLQLLIIVSFHARDSKKKNVHWFAFHNFSWIAFCLILKNNLVQNNYNVFKRAWSRFGQIAGIYQYLLRPHSQLKIDSISETKTEFLQQKYVIKFKNKFDLSVQGSLMLFSIVNHLIK